MDTENPIFVLAIITVPFLFLVMFLTRLESAYTPERPPELTVEEKEEVQKMKGQIKVDYDRLKPETTQEPEDVPPLKQYL